MARFKAIKWAREVPTLLNNKRVDRVGHHLLLLLATYAKNDGTDVFVSDDVLAQELHAPLKETVAALRRLEGLGLIRAEHASNGAAGWALNVDVEFGGDAVAEERAKRRRAAAAERKRRQRERSGHAEVERDVTPNSGVTDDDVTPECHACHAELGRDTGNVTHQCHACHAQVGVTPAGQRGSNSLELPKDELPKELPENADAEASEQATLIDFPTGRSKAPRNTPSRDGYTADFEAFWTAYGRKGGKREAAIEWHKAVKRADRAVIMAAVQPYLDANPDVQYRKDAVRWLKNDCWESAPVARQRAAGDYQPYRSPADQSAYDDTELL